MPGVDDVKLDKVEFGAIKFCEDSAAGVEAVAAAGVTDAFDAVNDELADDFDELADDFDAIFFTNCSYDSSCPLILISAALLAP